MKPLAPTPLLTALARRIVWFKEPPETLADPIHFLAYAMKLGTADDLGKLAQAGIGLADFSEVLDRAPAGIFDARSWTYWNLRCGRRAVPPLPTRNLGLDEGSGQGARREKSAR
jgi:hypothetical protein